MRANGRPKTVIVQSGVKAHTNDVMAPPKKTTPMADATKATTLAKIANRIFGPGNKDFKTVTNDGVES